jgi:hypothetical protein
LTAVVIAVAVALVVAVVVVAAPVAVTALAGGAVLGTAAMAAGDVALVSIGSGLIAGELYLANNSDASASSKSDANKSASDNSGNTANGDPNGSDKPPIGDFRDKLQKHTKATDEQINGKQAHHIFPQKFEQQFWEKWRIDINDPKYGSWVDDTHQDWSPRSIVYNLHEVLIVHLRGS